MNKRCEISGNVISATFLGEWKFYLAFYLIILIFSSCEYFDYKLSITNKLKYEIAVQMTLDSIPEIKEFGKAEYYLGELIKPEQTVSEMQGGKKGWDFYLKRSKNNMLNVVVFEGIQLRNSKNILFLLKTRRYKLYKFSEDELKKVNWKIAIE